jgi:GTP-binding protein
MTGRDPLDDLAVIDAELAAYSPELAARPQIVVANKADLFGPRAPELAAVERHCRSAGVPFHAISAATGAGLPELLRSMALHLVESGWLRAAS